MLKTPKLDLYTTQHQNSFQGHYWKGRRDIRKYQKMNPKKIFVTKNHFIHVCP